MISKYEKRCESCNGIEALIKNTPALRCCACDGRGVLRESYQVSPGYQFQVSKEASSPAHLLASGGRDVVLENGERDSIVQKYKESIKKRRGRPPKVAVAL